MFRFRGGLIHLNSVSWSTLESSSGLFGFNNLQAAGPRRGLGLLVVVVHGLNQRVEPGLRTDSVLRGAVRRVSHLWWKHIERRQRGREDRRPGRQVERRDRRHVRECRRRKFLFVFVVVAFSRRSKSKRAPFPEL